MKTKLFSLALALLMSVSLFAQSGTCGPNLTWTLQNGVLTISGSGVMTKYSYGSNVPWYSYRQSITSVVIGDSVTSIGDRAFSGCSGLTSITIPNSVTSIGDYAFYSCSGLKSVTIPNSVTSIGESAFSYCSGLTSVTMGNGVTSIGGSAFMGCSGLTSVTIPDSVTSVGNSAFNCCSGLTSVAIGNSVTSIGGYAFYGCSELIYVTIKSDFIVKKEYSYNDNIKNIFGSQVSEYIIGDSVTSIGNSAFRNCSGLTSVTIPNSVTSIGESAFRGCSGLTSVTIPNSVTSIGNYAFYGCSTLQTIYLKSSTPSQLVYDVFGNTGLTNIYVPCGALNTYQNAEGWSSYASYIKNEPSIIQGVPLVEGTGSVNIPKTICEDTIEAIPAFGYHFVQWTDGSTDNPRVINPEIEATYIADFAVNKSGTCGDGLLLTWTYDSDNKILTISGNCTFNSNIYYGMEAPSEMTSLVIEDSVQSIGANAFYSISTLTSVTLGQDVSRIRENAFYNCENLTVIRNYRSTPATVYSTTFEGVDKYACTLYVPEGSVNMYSAATGWRDFYNIQGFDPESAIENVSEESTTRKLLRNGQLYILLPDGTRFDATGRKVE